MRSILFTALLLLFTGIVGAQDLIVTNQGDSINCYVDMDGSERTYRIGICCENGVQWKRIPQNKVLIFSKGFYKKNPEVSSEKLKEDQIFPRWRFALDLGYGYLMKKGSSIKKISKVEDNLRHGLMVNIHATYFWSKNVGIGLLLKSHNSSSNMEQVKLNLHHYHLIPAITYRKLRNKKKDAFYFSGGIGPVFYIEKASGVFNSKTVSSRLNRTGYSLMLELGYDIGICKNLALGGRVCFTSGDIKIEENMHEDGNHFSITAGVRYFLW